ncbi:hypothetical protein KL86APRO_30149 [uncultured Alphaproteobacteria bacterium]|uniref:Uncharacterized protein n=1 Tax=uncultured Alphaproteobacteria bacterium TaxID=91750 RepID=A0A212KLX6_9PROT|nr:hypothetical protein KL86APRO_30149 [uncultured Alphaproteobacteria bacterium]
MSDKPMSDKHLQAIIRAHVEQAMDLLTWGGRRSLSDVTEDEMRRTIHACAEMCVEAASKDASKAKGRPESLPNGADVLPASLGDVCSASEDTGAASVQPDTRGQADPSAQAIFAQAETGSNAGSAAE